jgi:hypothetical protein
MHLYSPQCTFLHDGAMNTPTRALLALFAAALRLMEDETLEELHSRFVELDEHPAAIAAIEHEIARRNRPRTRPSSSRAARGRC